MHSEYKRDMNHNYLILHGDVAIDTTAYQVRMLAGNVVPSLVKCRIQGVDGKFAMYYDITSRQSIAAFYENKMFGEQDLLLVFGAFIRVLEETAEYLMNPEQLVLLPEYMFLEVEEREISFCFMPGYQKDVKAQFQKLTEYILPKIDHEDEKAVAIGYGVYRRAMEDSFHLEHIKEELYRGREEEHTAEVLPECKWEETSVEKSPDAYRLESIRIHDEADEMLYGNRKREFENEKKGKNAVIFMVGFGGLAGLIAARAYGYFRNINLELILGGVFVCMGAGMLIYLVRRRLKKLEKAETTVRGFRGEYAEESGEAWRGQLETEVISRETSGNITALEAVRNCGETVVLSRNVQKGPASLVSREPGELATIYLENELTVIGKLKTASDAVIDLPTVSRVHAKIRKREEEYYLTDLNSRNGTAVNGRILKAEEEYCLKNEDEVDFAQARYIFLE